MGLCAAICRRVFAAGSAVGLRRFIRRDVVKMLARLNFPAYERVMQNRLFCQKFQCRPKFLAQKKKLRVGPPAVTAPKPARNPDRPPRSKAAAGSSLRPLAVRFCGVAAPAARAPIAEVKGEVGSIAALEDVVSDQAMAAPITAVLRILALAIRPGDDLARPLTVRRRQQLSVGPLRRRRRDPGVQCGNRRSQHFERGLLTDPPRPVPDCAQRPRASAVHR